MYNLDSFDSIPVLISAAADIEIREKVKPLHTVSTVPFAPSQTSQFNLSSYLRGFKAILHSISVFSFWVRYLVYRWPVGLVQL